MTSRVTSRRLIVVVLCFVGWASGCAGVVEPGTSPNAQPQVVSLTISPASTSLAVGGSIQFAALVNGVANNSAVTWLASIGSITSTGLYTAPSSAGTVVITAKSISGPNSSATATVTVNSPPPISQTVTAVTISPASASSTTGGTLPFTATVAGTTSNKTVTWAASLGSITSAGIYKAPANPGTATITATSNADPTKSGSATVTVTAPAPAPPAPNPTPTPLPTASSPQLPPAFFGQNLSTDILYTPSHYPSVSFGALRLWDTSTHWMDIETSEGTYDWTTLDRWLALAQNEGKDVLYTFGKTPKWASLRPNEPCLPAPLTGCSAPPSDVDSGDNLWKAFVTALVQHSLSSPTAHITHYEIWNEPDRGFWTGTYAQMVTMAKDAYAVIHALDPSALVLGPSPSSCCTDGFTWLQNYYAAGGAGLNAQDIVAYHAYPSALLPEPTALPESIDTIRGLMSQYGIADEPLWFTEGSWDGSGQTSLTSEQQVAYLAQQYLFVWAKGAERYYWFSWDSSTYGTLWQPTTGILPPGTAYGLLYNWLVGSVHPTPACSQDTQDTWTCNLTLANGDAAEIVWNPNTAQSFTTGPIFTTYQTLDDSVVHSIVGNTVTIGNKPILLVANSSK
jgi:hypothetical protein